jgi:hypothetical protein
MTDELSWLQQWYSAHCDGVWEHSFGITIETIDNPGWSVTISLERTELESIPFEPVKAEANERNWVQCRVAERGDGENQRRFKGRGGASNLSDIIGVFRRWTENKR